MSISITCNYVVLSGDPDKTILDEHYKTDKRRAALNKTHSHDLRKEGSKLKIKKSWRLHKQELIEAILKKEGLN